MVEIKEDVQQKNAWLEQTCKCKCKQSVGEKKLKYVQPKIMPSYAPVKAYKPPETKMSDSSTYKLSFEAFDQKVLRQCRGIPLIAKENIVPAGEFSGYTTHKMSYGSWVGIPKEKLIYPKDHNLNGEGPMSSMTTSRHDFTAKRIHSNMKFVPRPNLGLSTAKMDANIHPYGTAVYESLIELTKRTYINELRLPQLSRIFRSSGVGRINKNGIGRINKNGVLAVSLLLQEAFKGNTTNMLSYQCPDFATFDYPVSYKPQSRYLPPSSPLDGNTVNKLSYLPWQPLEKEDLPWKKKCPYVPPSVPLDTNTIYNGSFIAPGTVVEDDSGHCEGCECLVTSECEGFGESNECRE